MTSHHNDKWLPSGTEHVGIRRQGEGVWSSPGRYWECYDRETGSRIGPILITRFEAQAYASYREVTTYVMSEDAKERVVLTEHGIDRHHQAKLDIESYVDSLMVTIYGKPETPDGLADLEYTVGVLQELLDMLHGGRQ